jgi:hypothetical protein
VKTLSSKPKRLLRLLLLVVSLSLCARFAETAVAIIPEITDVLVWESDGDVIINVTVYHTPVQTFPVIHRVDRIEVNVSGTIHIFDLTQTTETFTYPCNIGPVEGTPLAQVRVHCTQDGYCSWTEPFLIPEFQWLALLLTLTLGTVFATFALRRKRAFSA